jgi:hypothetical protein
MIVCLASEHLIQRNLLTCDRFLVEDYWKSMKCKFCRKTMKHKANTVGSPIFARFPIPE